MLLPCLVPPLVLATALFVLGMVPLLLGKVLGLGLQAAAADTGPAQVLGFALKPFCSGQVGG